MLQKRKPKLIFGIDVETILKGKVCLPYSFQVFSDDVGLTFFSTKLKDFELFISKPFRSSYFFSANLEFDSLALLKRIAEVKGYTLTLVYSRNRLIRASLKDKHGHVLHFFDILALYPTFSVKRIGKLYQIPKLKRPSYLGYREPSRSEKSYFVKYALRDAEIHFTASKKLYDDLGFISPTIGSVALTLFKELGSNIKKWFKLNEEMKAKFRMAYRGGRCEAFYRGTFTGKINLYDVVGEYPFVAKANLFPNPCFLPRRKFEVNLDKEGLALCEVKVEGNIPPLGIKREVKVKNFYGREYSAERLIFPEGIFTDWFTYPELRYIEVNGFGKIRKVFEAFEWMETCYLFKNFVEHTFRKRKEHLQAHSPLAMVWKIIMNSLFGKLGEMGEITIIKVKGKSFSRKDITAKIQQRYHPELVGYISAYARLYLHQLFKKCGFERVFYCDTDSIFTTSQLNVNPFELGGLSLKNQGKAFNLATFVRAKFYIFNDVVKLKGVRFPPLGNRLRLLIKTGELQLKQEEILKLRKAIKMRKEPLFSRTFIKRVNLFEDGKRIYHKIIEPKDLIDELTSSKPLEFKYGC